MINNNVILLMMKYDINDEMTILLMAMCVVMMIVLLMTMKVLMTMKAMINDIINSNDSK